MKTKTLQIRLTADELSVVREAARRAGTTASQLGANVLLKEVLQNRKPDQPEVLRAIEKFERLFCDAMELNLSGKLTAARLRALAERRAQ